MHPATLATEAFRAWARQVLAAGDGVGLDCDLLGPPIGVRCERARLRRIVAHWGHSPAQQRFRGELRFHGKAPLELLTADGPRTVELGTRGLIDTPRAQLLSYSSNRAGTSFEVTVAHDREAYRGRDIVAVAREFPAFVGLLAERKSKARIERIAVAWDDVLGPLRHMTLTGLPRQATDTLLQRQGYRFTRPDMTPFDLQAWSEETYLRDRPGDTSLPKGVALRLAEDRRAAYNGSALRIDWGYRGPKLRQL